MTTAIAIMQALLTAVPKIVELIRYGRDIGSIKLSEVISSDALETLERAQSDAQNYVDNG